MHTGKRDKFSCLPPEILDDIVCCVNYCKYTNVMRLTSYLWDMVARWLYNRVKISGPKGRKILRTIIETRALYGLFVSVLVVIAACKCDVLITYQLCCRAASKMPNIVDLQMTFCLLCVNYLTSLFFYHRNISNRQTNPKIWSCPT